MPQNGVLTEYGDNGYPIQPRYTSALAWNGIGLAAPAAATTATATTGGTVLAGTYLVIVTYVNAAGESLGSASASQVTTGSTSTLTVDSPAAGGGATGWYAYVTQLGGSTYTRQQTAGSPTAIGTNLTITAPPTSTGANPPASNTTGGIIRAIPGRLSRAIVTTALTGSGGNLTIWDSATGQPSGSPLLVIPVSGGSVATIQATDLPAASGLTALGYQLTAGAVTIGYS